MSSKRRMVLGAVTRGTGSHVAGWRHPSISQQNLANASKLSHYAEIAHLAEAAKFHFMFLADSPVATYQSNPRLMARGAQDYYLEPMTLLAALAPLTQRIGLVGSLSTTYSDPFTAARVLASLDHLSNGRASWNIVTTSNPAAAQNFSRDKHLERQDRYQLSNEFVSLVKGLWDSWEDDAFLRDAPTGRFLDPGKMHPLHHKSENFQVRGPLNVERPPQGHPVLFVAGSSDGAKEMAAETGDALFTAQPELKEAQRFYADVKSRLPKYGRHEEDLLILPGAMIITGETDAEARQKHQYLKSLVDIDFAVDYMSNLAGIDLSGYPLDQPLPNALRENPNWSRVELILGMAAQKNMTFREIAMEYADSYGHQFLVGSGETIADALEELFVERAADGFLLRSPYYMGGLMDTIKYLFPALRRRDLFHSDYEGATLRENLGLKRPPHPSQADQPQAMSGQRRFSGLHA